MNLPPRRRWFRFSLRALFLVVTAFGCWLGYQLNWIRQREEFLASGRGSESIYVISHQPIRAPRVLSLLGERGRVLIEVSDSRDVAEARRLFPEANISHAGTTKTPLGERPAALRHAEPATQADRPE